jgi:hypothetical protein
VKPDFPFDVQLARRVLLHFSATEFQRLAILLIESGYEASELHELAWEPFSSMHESQSLFDAAARRIGLALPTRQEAVQILLYHYATRITGGESTPHDELHRLMKEVYCTEVSIHQSSVFVGDSYDMQHFIGAYWSYEDMMDSPNVIGFNGLYGDAAIKAFDEHVRRTAAEWLTRHPEPPRIQT